MSDYQYQEFPKWKYAVDGGVIVEDADAETALGAGWFAFPEDVVNAQATGQAALQAAADQAAQDLLVLRETAKDLGIAVDGRWSASRLETEIKAKIEASQVPPSDSLV
jgi:hypothetical protein